MTKNTGLENFLVFGAPDIREDEIAEVVDSLRSVGSAPAQRSHASRATSPHYKGIARDAGRRPQLLHRGATPQHDRPGSALATRSSRRRSPSAPRSTPSSTAGATPVLADVDPRDHEHRPGAHRGRASRRERAPILPVHFAGRPCDMDAIMAIAERHDLKVIEDCAHAIETEYHGRKAGTFGDFGCFSFYVTKNVVTGEGGMVAGRGRGGHRPHQDAGPARHDQGRMEAFRRRRATGTTRSSSAGSSTT